MKNLFLVLFILVQSALFSQEIDSMTFSMIKPSAVREGHIGDIIQKIEQSGFHIAGLRMKMLTKEEASSFYKEHETKPFFQNLVKMITSGPVVLMALEKEHAVTEMRALVGSTDPKKAQAGTIRALYGKNIEENGIHASDSPKSAEREISFFFSTEELIAQ